MKFTRVFILTLLSFAGTCSIFAQDSDEILMYIGKIAVSKGEFERMYHKNNPAGQLPDQKKLDEYLDLFINFKLKVLEAESLGLDTLQSFKTELEGYRDQLAKSYVKADEVNDSLIREAYDRSKWEIDVSHILIMCDANATPADTLAAWNKIVAVWNRLKKGDDFGKLAAELSQDPSAKKNNGHLGFFTVFQMVYPFESAAYNTPVGSFSAPFRTRFGYHIVKVNQRIAARGQVKAAHIMKAVPENSSREAHEKARKEIYALYDSLKMGADFGQLAARHSDDGYTAKVNGELGWFGVGRMIPPFEAAAFALKNPGDYSIPFQTAYGWHIVKLLDKKGIPGFQESKNSIIQSIQRSDRAGMSRQIRINALKKQFSFTENLSALTPFSLLVDSTVFSGKWNPAKAATYNEPLFTILDKTYTQHDFALFLASGKETASQMPLASYVAKAYHDFADATLLEAEKERLDKQYPEFHYLMQEYHDGILLFNLTDQLVWSKAQKDTSGLEAFYNANRDRYQWKERLEASVYTCNNAQIASLARPAAVKRAKKNLDKKIVYLAACPHDTTMRCLRIEDGAFEKGDNELIDKQEWKRGISADIDAKGKVVFVVKRKVLKPAPKTLAEARGLVIADYQDYLEKEWVKSLRAKYPVVIRKEVFLKVK